MESGLSLTVDMMLVLTVLVVTIGLFVFEVVRVDIVAVTVMVLLGLLGLVPGDGIHSAFIEIMGIKRAAYALLTCEMMDAQKCLEYGLVNEVVPRDQLDARAWEIAERINARKRTTVRMSVPVIRRPWKKRIADDLDGGFAMEMHAYMCDSPEHRDDIGRVTYARSERYDEADRKRGIRNSAE